MDIPLNDQKHLVEVLTVLPKVKSITLMYCIHLILFDWYTKLCAQLSTLKKQRIPFHRAPDNMSHIEMTNDSKRPLRWPLLLKGGVTMEIHIILCMLFPFKILVKLH